MAQNSGDKDEFKRIGSPRNRESERTECEFFCWQLQFATLNFSNFEVQKFFPNKTKSVVQQ